MRIQNKWVGATGIAAIAALFLAGCGGGGNSDSSGNINLPTTITRATESDFTASARILAARDAAATGDTWLSYTAATQYDADLAAIRAAHTQVQNIEALAPYDLRTIVVTVPTSVSWASNWQSGNPATGEKAVDDLLTEFAPEKVEALGTPTGDTAFFKLTFGQSLNMVKLADRLKSASANIKSAEPNYTKGDGNNIRKIDTNDGTRQYAFIQGWGDCSAGCINRHQWNFTLSPDGKTATLASETGTPITNAPAL